MSVPSEPRAFFTEYLPSKVAALRDKLTGKTSAGCLTFRVLDVGEWSLRVTDGELVVRDGMDDDVIVQVSVSADDFVALVVAGAREQEGKEVDPQKQVMAFKALSAPPDRVKLVRSVPGSMAFVIRDGEVERRLAVTPGAQPHKIDAPDCRVECEMLDFADMQAGKQQALQLVMQGKMKMVGNPQIPMALTGVFA